MFLAWAVAAASARRPPLVQLIPFGTYESLLYPEVMDAFNLEAIKLGLQGVTLVTHSGDDGAAGYHARYDKERCGDKGAYFPATSPYVTVIGGTLGIENDREEVACQSDIGGTVTSGGGFSTVFPVPDWQSRTLSEYSGGGVGGRGCGAPTSAPALSPTVADYSPTNIPSSQGEHVGGGGQDGDAHGIAEGGYEQGGNATSLSEGSNAKTLRHALSSQRTGQPQARSQSLPQMETVVVAGGRGYPDASFAATSYLGVSGGALYEGCGTSLAAVTFSSMISLLNELLLRAGKPPVGLFNPTLYAHGACLARDVTRGSNRCTMEVCCEEGYEAGVGWDPVTGFGSLDLAKLMEHYGVGPSGRASGVSPSEPGGAEAVVPSDVGQRQSGGLSYPGSTSARSRSSTLSASILIFLASAVVLFLLVVAARYLFGRRRWRLFAWRGRGGQHAYAALVPQTSSHTESSGRCEGEVKGKENGYKSFSTMTTVSTSSSPKNYFTGKAASSVTAASGLKPCWREATNGGDGLGNPAVAPSPPFQR